MYNMQDLLSAYEQPITITTFEDGSWNHNTGQFEPGDSIEEETTAAILPISPDDTRYDELEYHTSDRKMYYHDNLPEDAVITVGGVDFSVMQRRDYSHHASGLVIYIIRRTDAGE